jgi:hypothetical protein
MLEVFWYQAVLCLHDGSFAVSMKWSSRCIIYYALCDGLQVLDVTGQSSEHSKATSRHTIVRAKIPLQLLDKTDNILLMCLAYQKHVYSW